MRFRGLAFKQSHNSTRFSVSGALGFAANVYAVFVLYLHSRNLADQFVADNADPIVDFDGLRGKVVCDNKISRAEKPIAFVVKMLKRRRRALPAEQPAAYPQETPSTGGVS